MRIEDAKPVVVVAASCGIEPKRVVEYKPMLDAALDRSSHKPEAVIVLQREQARAAVGERDTDWEEMEWDELMADAEATDCVEVAATDPLTSSTPPARPAGPRASCATTAAMPSPFAGRWRTSTTSARRRVVHGE